MKINYKALLFSIIGALFLLGFAFYNGYPIVYSDTSTYIASGFSLQPPQDRPIIYGLFIRIFSLNGFSLWIVAFIQSLIISYLLLLTVRDFTNLKNPSRYFLFVIASLSILSVISFVSGQIITDIFTSIGILCILNLTLNAKLKRLDRILLYIIFAIANAMHMSHLIINFLLLLSILIIKRFFFKNSIILKYRNIWILFALTMLGIFSMGSSLSKSKHVFFMGRMAENGILIQFLNDNCQDKKYKLCDCIDSIPANSTEFLWDKKSPLYTRYASWSESREEFNRIIWSTFWHPKYLIRHICESGKSTCRQLISFSAGDGTGPFVGKTDLFERIKKYFSSEAIEYSHTRQSRGLLKEEELVNVNNRYCWIIIISTLMLILIFNIESLRNQISTDKKFLICLLLGSIILNSFVNASLVIVTDRFGAKLIWLIPFIILVIFSELDLKVLWKGPKN